jgi:hypothetical protein
MRTAILVSMGMLIAGRAAADEPELLDFPRRAPTREVGIGYLLGGAEVGGLSQEATGLAVAAGVRRDRWRLLGEYDALFLDDGQAVGGVVHRLGGFVRRDVSGYGLGDDAIWGGGSLWLEIGVGHQHVRAASGARLDRTDLGLGLGGDFTIVYAGGRRSIGASYAARVLVARAPDLPAMAALCTGACAPDGVARHDVGIFSAGTLWLGK